MSVRTEIREAIDEVTPPAPGLEWKVEDFVKSSSRARHKPARRVWTRPLRGSLALVAVGLVIALVAGLILAGRLWRDVNAPPQTVNQTELKSLDGQPLNFPAVQPGAACPATPGAFIDQYPMQVAGKGPFYDAGPGIVTKGTTSWGDWGAVGFVYSETRPGLVLIRAKDLKANALVVFAQYPYGPSRIIAVGRLLGTDRVIGYTLQMRSEAVAPDAAHTKPINTRGQLPDLNVFVGLQHGGSGCLGFQVDGPGFTDDIVINLPPPWPEGG